MRVKSSAFAALAAGLALAASAAPTRAQSLLGGLIERCSRGDMVACSQATRLSALQANARAARNAPASSPGVGAVTGNGMYVYCAAPSVCGARGANALPGNWSWTSDLFGDLRRSHPHVWRNMYPGSYR
jgi:hypothetical protein